MKALTTRRLFEGPAYLHPLAKTVVYARTRDILMVNKLRGGWEQSKYKKHMEDDRGFMSTNRDI